MQLRLYMKRDDFDRDVTPESAAEGLKCELIYLTDWWGPRVHAPYGISYGLYGYNTTCTDRIQCPATEMQGSERYSIYTFQ